MFLKHLKVTQKWEISAEHFRVQQHVYTVRCLNSSNNNHFMYQKRPDNYLYKIATLYFIANLRTVCVVRSRKRFRRLLTAFFVVYREETRNIILFLFYKTINNMQWNSVPSRPETQYFIILYVIRYTKENNAKIFNKRQKRPYTGLGQVQISMSSETIRFLDNRLCV